MPPVGVQCNNCGWRSQRNYSAEAADSLSVKIARDGGYGQCNRCGGPMVKSQNRSQRRASRVFSQLHPVSS